MKNVSLALAEPVGAEEQAPEERVATPRVLSAIVTVLADAARIPTTLHDYHQALTGQGFELEFIYVLARQSHRARAALEALKAAGAPVTLVVLSRCDGEVAAIRSGLPHARGEICMLLPVEAQVEGSELPRMLEALDAGSDMAIARRVFHEPSWLQRLQNGAFHALIHALFGRAFKDLACRVRVCRRQVLEEILGHSTQHQFLGLLATERGFEVREVPLKATDAPANVRGFAPARLGARLRLVLDALALYLVLKYIRKPFRFFGAIGLPILASGTAYAGILAFERIWLGVALADRPALILAVLLIVLGIQVIVMGLIGEIIIFASGRRLKDYTVDRIL